ncbi:hypothetical protein AVEN_120175-1 [Araneus ventricosus]|uniref:Uncharacterized protein n=1 Tax=Araneus ventricosus TaxID=182803 RepID=A0A4Y2GRK5_ARAVE|nr:hypothetical protein AVEN_120175-1 [Araneus ventricosus]
MEEEASWQRLGFGTGGTRVMDRIPPVYVVLVRAKSVGAKQSHAAVSADGGFTQVAESRYWHKRDTSSEPNFTGDQLCTWSWCTVNPSGIHNLSDVQDKAQMSSRRLTINQNFHPKNNHDVS